MVSRRTALLSNIVLRSVKCDEISKCVEWNGNESCSPGTCHNQINGFSCSCPTGHKIGAGEHGEACEVEVCGEAPAVEHSTRNDTSPIVFGKAVEYHSDTGYSVDGKIGGMSNWVTTCLANGNFSGNLTCKPIS